MKDFDVTSCYVVNKYDNISIIVCTEWFLDLGLKLTIFVPESNPLVGEMKLSDIDMFSKKLSKPQEEYLEIARKILSGKDSSVEFVLKDMELKWNKGMWKYGSIELKEAKLEEVFLNLLKKFMNRNSDLEKLLEKMKEDNAELRTSQNLLKKKLDDIIEEKDEMEENLYRKFIPVLNSKKEKIRELEKKLNEKYTKTSPDDKKNKIYEAETDHESSETDSEEKSFVSKEYKTPTGRMIENILRNKSPSSPEEDKLFKRRISDSQGKMIDSDYEEDRKSKKNCKLNGMNKRVVPIQAKASTSKILDVIEERKDGEKIDQTKSSESSFGKSIMDFEIPDSEEDMFA